MPLLNAEDLSTTTTTPPGGRRRAAGASLRVSASEARTRSPASGEGQGPTRMLHTSMYPTLLSLLSLARSPGPPMDRQGRCARA